MGLDKSRERSLTNYRNRQNRLDVWKLVEFPWKKQSSPQNYMLGHVYKQAGSPINCTVASCKTTAQIYQVFREQLIPRVAELGSATHTTTATFLWGKQHNSNAHSRRTHTPVWRNPKHYTAFFGRPKNNFLVQAHNGTCGFKLKLRHHESKINEFRCMSRSKADDCPAPVYAPHVG